MTTKRGIRISAFWGLSAFESVQDALLENTSVPQVEMLQLLANLPAVLTEEILGELRGPYPDLPSLADYLRVLGAEVTLIGEYGDSTTGGSTAAPDVPAAVPPPPPPPPPVAPIEEHPFEPQTPTVESQSPQPPPPPPPAGDLPLPPPPFNPIEERPFDAPQPGAGADTQSTSTSASDTAAVAYPPPPPPPGDSDRDSEPVTGVYPPSPDDTSGDTESIAGEHTGTSTEDTNSELPPPPPPLFDEDEDEGGTSEGESTTGSSTFDALEEDVSLDLDDDEDDVIGAEETDQGYETVRPEFGEPDGQLVDDDIIDDDEEDTDDEANRQTGSFHFRPASRSEQAEAGDDDTGTTDDSESGEAPESSSEPPAVPDLGASAFETPADTDTGWGDKPSTSLPPLTESAFSGSRATEGTDTETDTRPEANHGEDAEDTSPTEETGDTRSDTDMQDDGGDDETATSDTGESVRLHAETLEEMPISAGETTPVAMHEPEESTIVDDAWSEEQTEGFEGIAERAIEGDEQAGDFTARGTESTGGTNPYSPAARGPADDSDPEAAPAYFERDWTGEDTGLFWEEDGARRPLPALWNTWKSVLVTPREFFAGVNPDGGFVASALYLLIFGYLFFLLSMPTLIGAAGAPSSIEISGEYQQYLSMLGYDMDYQEPVRQTARWAGVFWSVALGPLVLFYIALMLAGTMHFAARLFGSRISFDGSFKIVAYSSSVLVFSAFTGIGTILAAGFGFALVFVGYNTVGRLSPSRSIVTAAAPAIGGFFMFSVMALGAIVVAISAL